MNSAAKVVEANGNGVVDADRVDETPAFRDTMSRKRSRSLRATAFGTASVIATLALWEILTRSGAIDPVILVPPSQVLRVAARMIADQTLFKDALASAGRVIIGFLLSASAAIVLGLLLGRSRLLRAMFDPILSIIRPLPSLAWIPLAIMWFGIGEKEKYAIVFMGTFAPLLVLVVDAVERVDPIYVKAARNLGASSTRILYEVILPGAAPSIIHAMKVALAISWACIISAEMVGATSGLGFMIWTGKDYGDLARVIVGMFAISIVVVAVDLVFLAAERLVLPWLRTQRS